MYELKESYYGLGIEHEKSYILRISTGMEKISKK